MLDPQQSITAVLGKDVALPCFYRPTDGETVVQVTWLKRGEDGQGAELAVLHQEHGIHVQDAYAGRVLWQPKGSLNADSAVVLKNAVQADEGTYECHVSTFPLGSFESSVTLKVLGGLRGVKERVPGLVFVGIFYMLEHSHTSSACSAALSARHRPATSGPVCLRR